MKTRFVVALALLLSLAAAASVQVESPTRQEVLQGSVVDLGVVGPGQTVAIVIGSDAGEISRQAEGTVSGRNADWDSLMVLKESLPQAWKGEDSSRYENPIKANVLVSREAADGEYKATLKTIDEYEGVAPVEFTARVAVSRNVFEFAVVKEPVKASPAEGVEFVVELANTGSASDVFDVKMGGLQKDLQQTKSVLVRHNSKEKVVFAFNAPERGEYGVSFTATSQSSAELSKSAATKLFVGTSLLSDAKAASRGLLLFPTPQALAYSLVSLIGALFS